MSQVNKINPALQAIKQNRIVIIYRGLKPDECLEVSKVLYDAGIRLFEVTMNSQDTEDSIRLLHSELESDTCIGAGTVMDPEQVELAYDAGAAYIISPNTNVDVISRAKELFKAGCSAMGLGVQLLGKDLVENKNWEALRSNASEFVQASKLT